MDKKKYAVISRTNQFIKLENIDTREIIDINKDILDFDVIDGDILVFNGVTYLQDNIEKENRLIRITEKLNRLKKEKQFMYLVLIRHGESVWNKENRFTGWTDVDLSEKGINEAEEAGKLLYKKNIIFNIAYTSYLKRAKDTLKYVEFELNQSFEIKESWKLNERHYGALQGLNKDEMREKYGEEQVFIWRRSYDVRPPLLSKDDARYPGNDQKYKNLNEKELPLAESLKDTVDRVVPYYEETIKKDLLNKKNVLVVAHGNSLRALIKYLENISDDEITKLEIPTGKPIIYKLDDNLKIIEKSYE